MRSPWFVIFVTFLPMAQAEAQVQESSVSALLKMRRGYQTVADVIGSEQMGKSGDSHAGSSLRRVTGLSLVGGKYIYVRGLGERYSKTLLNSVDLPSPDPSRRVIPLDLFPASVIENIVVQKGYSPEMPGEFGGGTILIKTKNLPSKAYTKFSLSLGRLDGGGGDRGKRIVKTYRGSKRDFLGRSGRRRRLPSPIRHHVESHVNISSLPTQERQGLAKEINKSYDIEKAQPRENLGLGLGIGDRWKWGKVLGGYNLAVLYSNKWDFNAKERIGYNRESDELVEDSRSTVHLSQNKIQWGGLFGWGLKYKKHNFGYSGSLLGKTSNFVKESLGVNSEGEAYQKVEHGWRERSLRAHQFRGVSTLKSMNHGKLHYNYTYSQALLDEPDNKMYTYKEIDGESQLETENGSASNNVSWRYMPDKMKVWGWTYEQPLYTSSIGTGEATRTIGAKLISGWSRMKKYRQFSSRIFYFQFGENLEATKKPNAIFSDSSAELYQQSNNTSNYLAHQTLDSYFSNLRVSLGSWVWGMGLRFENSVQEVNSFRLFNPGKTISRMKTKDYFPVLSMTWNIWDQLQLRSNYSETISRPELREISNTTWYDLDKGAKFQGNPYIQPAEIKNYGVRLEWFPRREEILSVGYFRKNFINPIEEVFGALKEDGTIVETTDTQYTFLNVGTAASEGVELEFRKKLPYHWTVGGNYTWIQSNMSISPTRRGQLTTFNRPFQGQSPYIVNLQVDCEAQLLEWKTTWTLLYNSMGRRITSVGSGGRPDEYQESISSMDFVFSGNIHRNTNTNTKIKVKGKVKNILNPEVQRTQGQKVTRRFRQGRTYSVGLSYSF